MTLFIVISIVAALLAIAAYQLVLHKYYWGPQRPPKKDEREKKRER